MLKIYNTLTREKQEFIPIEPGKVRMYVCGMTVYDYCHVGHARVMVVFDMVVRWLRASGLEVNYVRNITDIDDKIIARAIQNKESIDSLTQRFIQAMEEDAAALGVQKPTHEPRATQYIDPMLGMINRLIENGLAYAAENGDVYYAVHKFPEYGKLSGKSLSDLRAGERVEINTAKRDSLDFVLWKASKPGEPEWDSEWGKGRPGWHLECSVMSQCHLGEHFDIHGGGQDLQFPHHENEIAQSEGATGHKYVNYWMHNGFVRVDNEKMSKSLGNFFTVREVLKKYDPEVLRFFILRAHYRSPLNYSNQHLDDAKRRLDGLYILMRDVLGGDSESDKAPKIDWENTYAKRFKEAMDDDFSTPEVFAVLSDLASEVHVSKSSEQATLLRNLAGLLGLLKRRPNEYLRGFEIHGQLDAHVSNVVMQATGVVGLPTDKVEQLIAQRTAARKAKNFAESDRIRDELLNAGILLEDTPAGTMWRRK